MLRQALSELNEEKNIKEGMPHYRHKLILESNVKERIAASGRLDEEEKQIISSKKTAMINRSHEKSKNEYIPRA